ncbi:3'-5' RNA exonuclease complex component [Podospora pseudopauciseta]|uniref:3'-5' RNA exonuclease complex component n=1 Tax=Podospora pseudopauciseta TaxID=2093780 RepID=A0ABR0HZH1_9PEZI|nr:3'-5' RNA exonuclease complex component [Podospora pseudopauciseta]
MLRSTTGRHYVCWRCQTLQKNPTQRPLGRISQPCTPLSPSQPISSRLVNTSAQTPGRLPPLPELPDKFRLRREPYIKSQLRLWEEQNPDLTPQQHDEATPPPSAILNSATRAVSDSSFRLDQTNNRTAGFNFDSSDISSLGYTSTQLEPGDLVEVSSSGWRVRLLAVCLGNFNGQNHFYTNTGKWFTSRVFRSSFVVKNFVQDPAEISAVISAIPSLSGDDLLLDELQDINAGPSRDIASGLIKKMYKFQAEARLLHQTYVERLNNAGKKLGDEDKLMSLHEIADTLLPMTLKRGKASFPPEALYAVHSVVSVDDTAFRAALLGERHHEGRMFTVNSTDKQRNVHEVAEVVRNFYEILGNSSRRIPRQVAQDAMKFRDFAIKVRKIIDQNRRHRPWTPHGTIGLAKSDAVPILDVEPVEWTGLGASIIQFMEMWAAHDWFQPASQHHWVGAAILRAIGRYQDALLDRSSAWTFLQEIGHISPWDISPRYALRLPGLELDRDAGLNLQKPKSAERPEPLAPDQLEHLRQDFAVSTVYCIDSEQTLDVDDGISLEKLTDEEYWVHLHVADPASRVRPDSAQAKAASLRAETVYLPGFQEDMFDGEAVRDAFSLGANQPSLTFSALVKTDGTLKDYRITPGILRDVVYVTPEEVTLVLDEPINKPPTPSNEVLEVGPRPARSPPSRNLVTAGDLSKKHRSELKTLHQLGQAIHKQRLSKGAQPAFTPRPKAKVALDDVKTIKTKGQIQCYNDPWIRVAYEGSTTAGDELVGPLMVLAGEVAARWCADRNIPIPYRTQVTKKENLETLKEFAEKVINPKLLAGERIIGPDLDKLNNLRGHMALKATPGPIFSMGVDAYSKVTSPLRRYADLIAHWQIEAALLEEHRLGRSLIEEHGSDNTKVVHKFLPFSKEVLEETVLPRVRLREVHATALGNNAGNLRWILQAMLRAWKFGDNPNQLPETFKFTVVTINPKRDLEGKLDYFDLEATVGVEHVEGFALIEEFKIGEVLDVELVDINVYHKKITVKPVRRYSLPEAE